MQVLKRITLGILLALACLLFCYTGALCHCFDALADSNIQQRSPAQEGHQKNGYDNADSAGANHPPLGTADVPFSSCPHLKISEVTAEIQRAKRLLTSATGCASLPPSGVLYSMGVESPMVKVYEGRYNSTEGGRLGYYIPLLLKSIASVKEKSPGTALTLVTDLVLTDLPEELVLAVDCLIQYPSELTTAEWGDKVTALWLSPYADLTMFLDVDTLACHDLADIFRLVEGTNYDIAMSLYPALVEEWNALTEVNPECPLVAGSALSAWAQNHYSSGLVVMKRNSLRMELLLREWKRVHVTGGDQHYISDLLLRSECVREMAIKSLTLAPNVHYPLNENFAPRMLTGPVYVTHGKMVTVEHCEVCAVPCSHAKN